MIMKN